LDLAWDFWDFLIWLDNQLAPDWAGRARLRLSSLEPAQLNEKGLRALAQCKMLAQHLHVSVQSGSYKVLRRMGRSHYHLDQIQAFLDELKGIWPRFALGGDFLVGFPGELESDLEATYGLIQSLAFTYGHVFPYSPRPQTAAAGLDHQVPAPVKKRRCRLLRQRLAAQKLAFIRSKARQEEVRYVVERYPAQGISGHYLPCREVSGLKPPIGSLVRAKPVGWDQTGLLVKAQDIL
jgi:tRNA A37 methylthiotransferase MiaB